MFKFIIVLNLLFIKHSIGNEFLFENFNNDSIKNWEFITDQVMGGVSYGNAEYISEGDREFARMTGAVSLENNGGFIQIRKKVTEDFSKNISALKIEVRGNNQEYYIHIRTTGTILPWQYYQAPFLVTDNWKTLDINLIDFKRSGVMLSKKINPKNIKSIAIVAYGKEHEAFVDINNITVY
jgi:hypothetical protein